MNGNNDNKKNHNFIIIKNYFFKGYDFLYNVMLSYQLKIYEIVLYF